MTNLEKLDTLPGLQKALEQERERAARLLEGQCALTARAEQAERERDETKVQIEALGTEVYDLTARVVVADEARERAERKASAYDTIAKAFHIDPSEANISRVCTNAAFAADLRDEALARANEAVEARLQAERERDEAREGEDAAGKHSRWVEEECAKRIDESETARERAEADNAALSKHIDAACHLLSLGQVERAVSYLRKAAGHEHPGSALLEYVRAMEAVFEVACEMDSGDSSTAAWTRLHEACAVADALKGKP